MRARCRADCIHRSRGRPPARFRWWSLSRCDPMSDVLFSPFGHPVLGSNQESSCSSVVFFTHRRFHDSARLQRSGDSPQGPGSFVRALFRAHAFHFQNAFGRAAPPRIQTRGSRPSMRLRPRMENQSHPFARSSSNTRVNETFDSPRPTKPAMIRTKHFRVCLESLLGQDAYNRPLPSDTRTNHGHPLIVELPPRSLASLGFPGKT